MAGDFSLDLHALAALVGGQLSLCPEPIRIRGVASIEDAGPEDVTFLANPKYASALQSSKAGAAFVSPDFGQSVAPVLIRVENPSVAFAKAVEQFAPKPVSFPPGIHPTAVVAEGVELGEGVSIQPHAVLERGAKVGANTVIGAHSYIAHGASVGSGCLIHPRVTIAERCVVGNRVILHSGCVVGSDGFGFETIAGKHVKIPQVGIVQIDDDVEIGANTTLDRARFGRTWIGQGTKIDNLVQIAHNVVIGKNCLIVSHVGISGSTRIGDGVTIAGQVGVVGHIQIGDGVVIGAQSGVNKSIVKPGLYMGTPAIPASEYREQVAYIHRLGRLADRVQKLERGGASGAH
jgi:UDP-3-O-[3-hydroxymyristoyl] glucosamine N-acyltransferase